MTLGNYSHVLPGMQEKAVGAMRDVLDHNGPTTVRRLALGAGVGG